MSFGAVAGAIGAAAGKTFVEGLANLPFTSSANSKAKRAELRNYDFQREMQQNQLKWEKEKFETAYQTAVKDLKKAGLNPVLAAMNGGNSAGSISGGSGTDIAGNVASQQATNISNSINEALNRLETQRVNNSVIDKNNAEANLVNENSAARRIENKYLNKRQKKELTKLDYETLKTRKEAELMELQKYKQKNTMESEIATSFANAVKTVSEGYIAKKDAEMLQTYGISRKEAFQLGEMGLKIVGNLINLGAGKSAIREVTNGIIKNRKMHRVSARRRPTTTNNNYKPNPYTKI